MAQRFARHDGTSITRRFAPNQGRAIATALIIFYFVRETYLSRGMIIGG
jgi:hypothetical protein